MTALPIRKPNRLKEYDYGTNGAYFITICTENRRNMLCDIVGGGDLDAPQVRLTDIGKITEKYILSMETIDGLYVQKYVIMPNHIHLLLQISDDGAPRSVSLRLGHLAVLTVHRTVIHCRSAAKATSPTAAKIPCAIAALKRFIHKDAGVKIFQRNYHDHIIRNEWDYEEIWKYIDENPLKWMLDEYYQT